MKLELYIRAHTERTFFQLSSGPAEGVDGQSAPKPTASVAKSKEFDPLSKQQSTEENAQSKVMSSFGIQNDCEFLVLLFFRSAFVFVSSLLVCAHVVTLVLLFTSSAHTPSPQHRSSTPDSVSSIGSSASNQLRAQQQQQQQQLQQQQQAGNFPGRQQAPGGQAYPQQPQPYTQGKHSRHLPSSFEHCFTLLTVTFPKSTPCLVCLKSLELNCLLVCWMGCTFLALQNLNSISRLFRTDLFTC